MKAPGFAGGWLLGLLFPRDSPQMTKPEYKASDAPFRKGAPRWESTILSTELTWRRQWWRGFVEGSEFVCFRSAHRQSVTALTAALVLSLRSVCRWCFPLPCCSRPGRRPGAFASVGEETALLAGLLACIADIGVHTPAASWAPAV